MSSPQKSRSQDGIFKKILNMKFSSLNVSDKYTIIDSFEDIVARDSASTEMVNEVECDCYESSFARVCLLQRSISDWKIKEWTLFSFACYLIQK